MRKHTGVNRMDREKVIKGLQNLRDAISTDFIHEADQAVGTIDDALALIKEQETEIAFLKAMQLQTVHNMSNEDIGNAVRNVLRL